MGMKLLKIVLVIILVLVFLILAAVVIIGIIRTVHSQRSPAQAEFTAGKVPDPLPDGFYAGSVDGLKTSWRGKKFNASSQSGINLFGNEEQYPFKTYVSRGASDRGLQTLKIDYNVAGNALWLRPILDEMVETSPGHYLGKVQLRLLPGWPFTLGYFRLQKP